MRPAPWLLLCAVGCSGADVDDGDRDMYRHLQDLVPLHRTIATPRPGDWLAQHEEEGQTFAEYLDEDPIKPTDARQTIYVLPLGEFTGAQQKVLDLTVEFTGRYFGRTVAVRDTLPQSSIPARVRRVHPSWGDHQVLTTYVLDEVLRPNLPEDAAAYIALTSGDLWPGSGWNFVFGQASLYHRVGVWSMYRNGDPSKGTAEFRRTLLRTMKTATHEIGHMFGMRHCTLYECNMCGSNNRQESDRKPPWLCPECLPKLLWATDQDAIERFERLAVFCESNGLTGDAEQFRKSIARLR